jgi:hypothetical protein
MFRALATRCTSSLTTAWRLALGDRVGCSHAAVRFDALAPI